MLPARCEAPGLLLAGNAGRGKKGTEKGHVLPDTWPPWFFKLPPAEA
ncbi:hypothetical protein [Neomoorella humiferrea]